MRVPGRESQVPVPAAALDTQVAARMARQSVLDRTQLWYVLNEGVLHREIGGSKAMQTQLDRLAALAGHPKMTIQVIPGSCGHAGLLGRFVLADLDGQPPVVYLETAAEGQVTQGAPYCRHRLRRAAG